MQVFGLPGHIIRNGRDAVVAGARQRPWRRAGRPSGRRSQLDAVSLGEGRRAEKPAAAPRPAEDMDARLAPGGGAVAAGFSRVGARQDRPVAARRRLRGLRRHRRAHRRRTRGAASFRPPRPCADAPMRAVGPPSAASPAACRAISS